MSSPLQKKQEAAQAAAQRDENLAVYQRWLATHPEIKDCTATLKSVEEFCDFGMPLAMADLDFALSNGIQVAKQSVPTESAVKADLIDRICELIASKDGTGRDGKYSTYQLEQERKKYQFWTVEQLTARLDEVVRKQTLSVKPVGELQEVVRSHYAPQNQRPALPAEFTAQRLKDRSFPVSELKKLIRMYGADGVNDRLFGRS